MHHHHSHTTNTAATTSTTTNSANTQQQQPTQRRRKKRPNYGTRTVEVRRGYSGFGFTISGQQPCRLSCIIPNSPADQAGLRAGDCLISVNGLNVSKLPHETVVQLIGNSFGSIRMQIAEHYYSDSTDEENAAAGSPAMPTLGPYRPRYVYHKTKQQRLRNSPLKKYHESLLPLPRTTQQATAKKCPVTTTVKKPSSSVNKPLLLKRPLSEELKSTAASTSSNCISSSTVANVRAMVRAPLSTTNALEYRAVVGYLGTIEMPKQIQHSSKLQTVRSCIRKLRQEKRTPSTVLIVILPDCLKLLSNTGNLLATYSASRLNYVSSSSESENRFFGLVTSAVHTTPPDEDDDNDEEDDDEDNVALIQHAAATDHISISNSCHVFVVDTKLCDHVQHLAKAQEFRIECTKDPISSLCLEFPNNSEYVVNLIRSMYTMRIIPPATQRSMSDDPNLHGNGRRHNVAAHSPQPSNHSEISTTTSNSDSGIGYNNDCSNITDRIVVVDFPQQQPNSPPKQRGLAGNGATNRPQNILEQDIQEDMMACSSSSSTVAAANKRLTVRAMPDPKIPYNLNTTPHRSLVTSRSCDDVLNLIEQETENYNTHMPGGLTSSLLPQQCYASMDDITLHPTCCGGSHHNNSKLDEEHEFLKPCKKQEKQMDLLQVPPAQEEKEETIQDKRNSLKLQIETWNSLQDLSCQSAEVIDSSPGKLASTPDLSKQDIDLLLSPFDRGWIQTSLRTPRSDKHTKQFALSPETSNTIKQTSLQQQQQQQHLTTPSVSRSASLTSGDADANSLKYKSSFNELSKSYPKGPTAWASSIEILLADPAGIKSFAEFLKLEYAAENIYFWTACERFRSLETEADRQIEALKIYTKHLSNGSLEPVNVDSRARTMVEQHLNTAEPDLFQPAQKQIFNLMKFDCYQRFLKSELYKQCLQAEKKGKPLPYTGDNLDDLLKTTNFSESASAKLKKSASNAEEGRRRRSLLPWHRKANHARSKSRDRIANEKSENIPASSSSHTKLNLPISDNIWKQTLSIHGSKSSLTSFDAIPVGELNSSYCRVKFPDNATTIIQLRTTETVAELVKRLFEKRGLQYQFFDVSINGPPLKSIDLQTSTQELMGKEIEIEQRVAFKLDLPTPKVISVKSKPKKQLYEVVRPILQRYNINPELVEVLMKDTQEKLDLTQLVTVVDNQRLQVVLKKSYAHLQPNDINNRKPFVAPKTIQEGLQTAQSTLDEITNKVFSDLMQVKNQGPAPKAKFDQCSLKSEECPSETSSAAAGAFLKVVKRNGKTEEQHLPLQTKSKRSIQPSAVPVTDNFKIKDKHLKVGQCKQSTSPSSSYPIKSLDKQDDLLEDLKRAQLARLEDQRGTEINFELPEFLKSTDNLNKSNNSTSSVTTTSTTSNQNISTNIENSPLERPPQPAPRLSITNKIKTSSLSPIKIDEDQKKPLEESDDTNASLKGGPPPLPPKPKVLPIKPSNWGVNMNQLSKITTSAITSTAPPPPLPIIVTAKLTNANVAAISSNNIVLSSPTNARCAYLDQPSSSFV